MPYVLEDDEIAILIKPMGDGQIGTCICKSDDHALSDEQLTEAMGVGIAMIGLFELLNDDHDGIYEEVKIALDNKVEQLLADNQVAQEAEMEPVYTTEGNVLRLNVFTRTKGSC